MVYGWFLNCVDFINFFRDTFALYAHIVLSIATIYQKDNISEHLCFADMFNRAKHTKKSRTNTRR